MVFKCPACKKIIQTFSGPFWITTPIKCKHCKEESRVNFSRHVFLYLSLAVFIDLVRAPERFSLASLIFIYLAIFLLWIVFYYFVVGLVPVEIKQKPKEVASIVGWTCVKCGEKHSQEFDSCWKCRKEKEVK